MNKYFIAVLLVSMFIGCTKTTEPIEIDIITTKEDLSKFQTILADCDSVVFKSNNDLIVKKKDVVEIIVGMRGNEGFIQLNKPIDHDKIRSQGKITHQNTSMVFNGEMAIQPIYTEVGNEYRLEFEIPIKVDKSVYIENFLLHFVLTDESYIEFEIPVYFYKYPYENAELVFQYNENQFARSIFDIQDFDLIGDWIYFHSFGGFGTFAHNLITNEHKDIAWNSGDWIATNSEYVFIDMNHVFIYRYNIEADSMDLEFDFSQIEGVECQNHSCGLVIYSMAVSNSIVYIVFYSYDKNNVFLSKFTLDGTYLGSDYSNWNNENPFGLQWYDDILYFYNYTKNGVGISRFDINKQIFLDLKPLPSIDPNGISINGGRFYYSDYYRNAIFSIPLSDLMD